MENKESSQNKPGKLLVDNDKFSAWEVDKGEQASISGACMEIHFETEKMYETRVYGLANGINIKILSKQSLRTGKIELVILKQNIDGNKIILGNTVFDDENAYAKRINEFEGMMPFVNKVVTSKEEYEQAMKKYEK